MLKLTFWTEIVYRILIVCIQIFAKIWYTRDTLHIEVDTLHIEVDIFSSEIKIPFS